MAKSTLLIKTIELLRDNPGLTIDELATQLGRSVRTAYRWLSELSEDLGTPVYCSDGGYYLNDWSSDDTLDLSAEEIAALRLSLRSSPFGSTSPIGSHAQSAWKKIREAVSYDKLTAARDMAATHTVRVNAPSFRIDSHILSSLETGLKERRRLRVIYRSQKSGEERDYLIDPYAMAFRRHSWYMLAYSHWHGKVRQFKLVRFHSVYDTGEHFDVPEDFDADEYFRLSWEAWAGGETTVVKVRFSPRVAQMIRESRRHPTQILHPQADGHVVFEVCVAGIEEIAIWIMGYGKDAEVLEPESLREHIAEHARGMLFHYMDDMDSPKKVEQLVGGLT